LEVELLVTANEGNVFRFQIIVKMPFVKFDREETYNFKVETREVIPKAEKIYFISAEK
jgi:hypothetical protein